MIERNKILAVVPARGGSKGIRNKNIQPIDGIPMVGYVGKVLKQLPEIDRHVVSTDSDLIAEVAEIYGIPAPFRRPQSISGDLIGDLDVLTHALQKMEHLDNTTYDIILMLQPTSPLRTHKDVRNCLDKLIDEQLDAVWTVSETDSKNHPLKQLTVGKNGELALYDFQGSRIIARQQLKPLYHRNGVAYAFRRDCILNQKSLLGSKSGAIVLEGQHISIDTLWDLALVEFLIKKNKSLDIG